MIRDGVATLHGFAWYARSRPGTDAPDDGGHPLDGVESKYRPLCWPIGPAVSGVQNDGPGPAFVIISPALMFLAFGPPEVGRCWDIEPAVLDGFQAEDGRIRVAGMEPHETPWGTLAVCEVEATPRPSEGL